MVQKIVEAGRQLESAHRADAFASQGLYHREKAKVMDLTKGVEGIEAANKSVRTVRHAMG